MTSTIVLIIFSKLYWVFLSKALVIESGVDSCTTVAMDYKCYFHNETTSMASGIFCPNFS